MRKTSLLITSFALLVGGGLLCSASPITPNARKATIEASSIYTYTKVESASNIVSGRQYIFTYDGTLTSDGVATGVNFMGAHTSKNIYSSVTDISEALLLTITQEADNNYSISFDDGGTKTYVSYSGSGNAAHTSTTYNNKSAWTFGEGKNGAIAVNSVGTSGRRLQYNPSQPRFACYTGSQKDLTIYEVEECFVFGMPEEDDKSKIKVAIKVVYNKEIVKEKYGDISQEELYKIIWNKIKEINKTLPKYKYMVHMILTDEPLIKTTTHKTKRNEELKKIETIGDR